MFRKYEDDIAKYYKEREAGKCLKIKKTPK